MKLFTETHEWFYELEDGSVYVGISDYAVEQLGDIVYVDLPEVEDYFLYGGELADIESIKSTSTIFAPVEGEVISINNQLKDNPEIVNDDPMGDGWLVKMAKFKYMNRDKYMTKEEYDNYVKEL